MNRLDYNRQALSPGSQMSSKTPRLPPPLRAFALRATVSTFHSPIRMRDHRQVSPLYERRRQSARVLHVEFLISLPMHLLLRRAHLPQQNELRKMLGIEDA